MTNPTPEQREQGRQEWQAEMDAAREDAGLLDADQPTETAHLAWVKENPLDSHLVEWGIFRMDEGADRMHPLDGQRFRTKDQAEAYRKAMFRPEFQAIIEARSRWVGPWAAAT